MRLSDHMLVGPRFLPHAFDWICHSPELDPTKQLLERTDLILPHLESDSSYIVTTDAVCRLDHILSRLEEIHRSWISM